MTWLRDSNTHLNKSEHDNSKSDKSALLCCPFCGNDDLRLIGNPLCEIYGSKMANVYCQKCQAQAPQSVWNKRAETFEKLLSMQEFKDLMNKQDNLGEEFTDVLYKNLEDLYTT